MNNLSGYSGLPQIQVAFSNWQTSITYIDETRRITDFESNPIQTSFQIMATVQPLSPYALSVKPEEQRAFQWLQIHANPDSRFKIGDYVLYNNRRYRIMTIRDHTASNYVEMHAADDLQDE